MRSLFSFFLITFILILSCQRTPVNWQIGTLEEWQSSELNKFNTSIMKDLDVGGEFDLIGNGALLLAKRNRNSHFAKSAAFVSSGSWTSTWFEVAEEVTMKNLKTDIIAYGKSIDMTRGWIKFSGNPVLSGGNTLLPLNRKNISDQTILLPEPPGGVPQDQSIIKGKGKWKGKWILFFNHTPDAWPRNYYWSFAEALSLAPLKKGINPFSIDPHFWPLFGPIDNQAPNDWIEIEGIYYAPDETYQSMSHLWTSEDMIRWEDRGVIKNKVGTDPGIVFDGERFHLFSENGHKISHSFLDINTVSASENREVLDVGDHTGDADVSFFNNQWHMFVDDGEHLFYKISYAVTSPDSFPYGWQLFSEIYGPHNPEQGQGWDDDTPAGNNFGTGDADVALEDKTLYLFTERPIGVAYKELDELNDISGLIAEAQVWTDTDNDGSADDSTGWCKLTGGIKDITFTRPLTGTRFQISFRLKNDKPDVTPMIRSFTLSSVNIRGKE